MTDKDATATPQDDSREEIEGEDSVNQPDQPEDKEPTGTPEAPAGDGEDTPESKNDDTPEDPEGAPEGEEEEADPLKKAKKYADQKISQMGKKLSDQRQALESAVKKSPHLLIELFDPNSEMHDSELANKIRSESPETYQAANRIYKERQGVSTKAPAKTTPQGGLTETQVQQMISQQMQTIKTQETESVAVIKLREALGYSEEEFSAVAPALKGIADSIRKANPDSTYEEAYRGAFLAMFPGDHDRQVAKDAYIKASAKVTASSGRGGATPSVSSVKLSAEDKEAARIAGLSDERYKELQDKGYIN